MSTHSVWPPPRTYTQPSLACHSLLRSGASFRTRCSVPWSQYLVKNTCESTRPQASKPLYYIQMHFGLLSVDFCRYRRWRASRNDQAHDSVLGEVDQEVYCVCKSSARLQRYSHRRPNCSHKRWVTHSHVSTVSTPAHALYKHISPPLFHFTSQNSISKFNYSTVTVVQNHHEWVRIILLRFFF